MYYWVMEINRTDIAPFVASERYAWPGGYEMFAVTDDDAVLCNNCCRDESERIADAVECDGFFVVGFDHMGNAEENETCDHCEKVIL